MGEGEAGRGRAFDDLIYGPSLLFHTLTPMHSAAMHATETVSSFRLHKTSLSTSVTKSLIYLRSTFPRRLRVTAYPTPSRTCARSACESCMVTPPAL